MFIPEIELQKRIYQALTSSDTYAVNDGWFEDSKLPLITIGDFRLEDGITKVSEGYIVTVMIHSWSDSSSSTEIKQMNHYIRGLMNELTMDGYRLSSKLLLSFTQKEKPDMSNDKIIHHGLNNYRFLIFKEEK